jgi:cytochrome c peroxidase
MHRLFLIFIFNIIIFKNLLAVNILPIPQSIDFDRKKALLGKELFFDVKLSIDETISCATCHNLKEGGDDGLQFSVGVKGAVGELNAPTVLNSVFNFRQFWDGRAKNLKEQALGPIENPIEMAHNINDLVYKLKNSDYYSKFFSVYKDGVTKDNIADALAEFEKTLITPNSRFDKYLLGYENSITEYEKEGFELFKNKGCITCHHGINIGGNHYNIFGAIVDVKSINFGRYNITKNENDKFYFKVPTLRNIELTSPYFHDGREYSLKDAVKTMALVQLGRPMQEEEIDKITAFLKTLTGKLKIIE